MASDNSHSHKDPKNVLHTVVDPIHNFFKHPKRSILPAPSEGSQGKSLKQKFLSRFASTSPSSQSMLSLPLTSSTEHPSGTYRIFSMYILNCNLIVDSSTSLTVTTLDGMPPNRSSLMMDSSQYPDHRTPPASSGSHPLATSPAVQS